MIGFDKAQFDGIVSEDEKSVTFSAIIAREMVQDYPRGKALKDGDELLNAAWTGEGRWVTLDKHPDTVLLESRKDIHGRLEQVRGVKDLVDPKTKRPMDRGIRANVRVFKDVVGPEKVTDLKGNFAKRDVSIGFTYDMDPTPGSWRGIPYDFVQRNIMIDHLAAFVEEGRCPSPYCGIGVDEFIIRSPVPARDMWEVTEEYIRSGHNSPDKFDPDSFRTIEITAGVKAIVGCPKGNFKDGKCSVGTEVQSFLFDKKQFNLEEAKAWFKKNQDMKDSIEKDKMTVEQIQAKIEGLYNKRDDLEKKRNELLRPLEVKADPEKEKFWREIEDLDLEIKAFKELKAKQIIEGNADCPLCVELETLGPKRFAAKMARIFGVDAVKKFIDADPGSEDPNKKPPVEPPKDIIIEVQTSMKKAEELLKRLNEEKET
jgi:hypothetical protein